MSDDLRRLFAEVGAAPPPPSDLGPAVRAATTFRWRGAGLLIVGFVVVLALAVYAAQHTFGGVSLKSAAPRATPSATGTPTRQTAAPTPSLGPATPAAVLPTVAPTVAPTAVPTRSRPTPAPVRPTPAPRPTAAQTYAPRGAGVSFTTSSSPDNGHDVTFTVTVKDNDGYMLSGTLDFGDGTQIALGSSTVTCGGQGYDPEPSSTTKTVVHSYAGPGSVTANVTVTTGSTCRPTPRETPSAYGQVNVP